MSSEAPKRKEEEKEEVVDPLPALVCAFILLFFRSLPVCVCAGTVPARLGLAMADRVRRGLLCAITLHNGDRYHRLGSSHSHVRNRPDLARLGCGSLDWSPREGGLWRGVLLVYSFPLVLRRSLEM